MRAQFQVTREPPLALLLIKGDLDISSGCQLSDVLASLTLRRCSQVQVDLGEVTFVDAYGLGLLRREQRRLREEGGDLCVVAASARFRQVCRLGEFETLVPVPAPPPRPSVLLPAVDVTA